VARDLDVVSGKRVQKLGVALIGVHEGPPVVEGNGVRTVGGCGKGGRAQLKTAAGLRVDWGRGNDQGEGARAMPKIYRGIDIAGDQGDTGFVDLVEEDDGRLWARCAEVDLTGRAGLDALIRVDPGEQLIAGAIDQPLGFPAGTLRLLAWPDKVEELPAYDPERGRYREADLEMREDLEGEEDGLKPDYVRPPVVCDNIWRAVYLVRAAGGDVKLARRGELPWFETHPRLCVLGLLRHTAEQLSLLAEYKKDLSFRTTCRACRPLLEAMRKKKCLPDFLNPIREETFHGVIRDCQQLEALSQAAARFAEANGGDAATQFGAYREAVGKVSTMLSARRRCLKLLTAIVPIDLNDLALRLRLLHVTTSDPFEALFCAVTAYAKAKSATRQYPRQPSCEADIDLEGLVFVPDYAKLRTVMGQSPT
jgi:Protein of unknown function (DUF429)